MKAYPMFLLFVSFMVLLAACGQHSRSNGLADGPIPVPAITPLSELPADTIPVQATLTSAMLVLLSDQGLAPEIANDTWINSDGPLTLAAQHGKVVLLEFWTFGCINCRRVIPYVRQWYDAFAGDDFQVLSIHYPEFAHERDYDNVAQATQRLNVAYPVALDNDGRTWRAYHQRYWPTTYLIDKNGHIRYKHIGEFNEQSAAQLEAAIGSLLAEESAD